MRRPILFTLIFLFGLGLALDAFWLEPSSLRLARYDVTLEAPKLKGLKIAVISDLHGGAPYIGTDKIDQVVALANDAHPDLILLTGDYVIEDVVGGRHMPVETIVAHLKGLKAPLGVYAVMGNHDRWEGAPHIARAFEQGGIPVLENAPVQFKRGGDVLTLIGIGDHYSGGSNVKQAMAGVPKDAQALCFTHSPDVFPDLPNTCALTIAGHTHGGQVWLPILGRIAVAHQSDYGQRYAIGVIRENGKTLFVSPGIGTSGLPVRFMVPPEVSLVTIK
ncbi:MAG TPA: metallophosphoesterase [Rhizomicrobium sp.]|jgi:predicted MPP superfamily phosphohydrolase|nr:metallophosphoesterase [Rhizomicrobium sp.]